METMVTGPSRSTSTEFGSDMAGRSLALLLWRELRTGWAFSATGLDLQLIPRYPAVRFEIALAGRVHHAVGQGRRRRVAVPAAGLSLGVEIVAQRLLVERRLRPARLVDIRR